MACQAGITVFSAHSLLPSTVGAGLGALCALLLGHFSLVPPLSISAFLEQMLLASWSGGNASAARAGNPEQAVWNPLALRRKLGGKGTHPWACRSCLSIWEPGVPVLLTQT